MILCLAGLLAVGPPSTPSGGRVPGSVADARSPLATALPVPTNADAAALSRVDLVGADLPGLNGAGVTVGIWDEGLVQADHPDLAGRVVTVDNAPVSGHATHVAGTIAGTGLSAPAARGMAPGAQLLSYDFFADVIAEQRNARAAYGMVLANHSWDLATGWLFDRYGDGYWVWYGGAGQVEDGRFGAYTSVTRQWDALVADTGLILVKSAGNDRIDFGAGAMPHHHAGDPSTLYTDYHKPDGDYDSIGEIGSAKNLITVGAVDDQGRMTSFSGWGPTDDGRVKPDLVANGTGLYSDDLGSGHASRSGTSMSTPVVTGVLALLVEQYRLLLGGDPGPALARALLVNSARDLGPPGPDYRYGWGLVDAWAAMSVIDAAAAGGGWPLRQGVIGAGGRRQFDLEVPAGLDELRLTLAWVDPPAAAGAARALVDDLDLRLLAPDGSPYYPYSLAGKADPAAPATATGPNRVDNLEQVRVAAPAPGLWRVEVTAAPDLQASQAWALVSNVYLGPEGPQSTDLAPPVLAAASAAPTAGGGGGGGGPLSVLALLVALRWPRRTKKGPAGGRRRGPGPSLGQPTC